jgi:hypothetical protein
MNKTLDITEAISAMKQGKKVANFDWEIYEYIQYDGEVVTDENGSEVNASVLMNNFDSEWVVVE